MWKKIIKTLFKSTKAATQSAGKSMDFIDDVLEKEYIATAVDNMKTSSCKIIEKAGMVYQQTLDTVEKNVDLDKLKDVGDKIVAKGKEVTAELSDKMEESSSTIKNVFDEGEQFVKDVMGDSGNEDQEEE